MPDIGYCKLNDNDGFSESIKQYPGISDGKHSKIFF